jgi:hypothetical protein
MIFPTAYFPSIYYVRELCTYQHVAIDLHEHWIKQSIRNRCEILTAEGIHKLIVPITHREKKQCIAEITVCEDSTWEIKHWRAIKSAYGNAPYFEAYAREIESILVNRPSSLWKLNQEILALFIDAWDLPVRVEYTDEFIPYAEKDLRRRLWMERKDVTTYQQVFSYDKPFSSNLSALDLLMCEGPMGRRYLMD